MFLFEISGTTNYIFVIKEKGKRMELHFHHSQGSKIIIAQLITFILSGCAVQVSALSSYNGSLRNPSNRCLVARTALEQKFTRTINKNNESIQGDSQIATGGSYENEEAAYDCMSVGAKSVLVLNRGIISSSTTYVNGTTSSTYNPTTNQYRTYTSPGYFISTNTSAYIVVFFDKEIPGFTTEITFDDYKSWKRRNLILGCDGCN